jgi:uncharacterized membrane protein
MEEVTMRVMRDLVMTFGDALRLSSDLMRHGVEIQKRVIKRAVSRLTTYLAVFMVSMILAAAGVGFILYGVFVLLAAAIASGAAAGLIMGFVLLVLAISMAALGRSLLGRP